MAARTRKPQQDFKSKEYRPIPPDPEPESKASFMFTLGLLWDLFLVHISCIPDLLVMLYYLVFPRPCKDVQGEIVLITGSGQGLGRELALLFAAQGAELVCVDIQADQNETTAREARVLGARARAFVCDVSDRASVFDLAKKVGRVDILVNNAGIIPFGSFWKNSEEELRKVTNINYVSQFWTLQAFVPAMKERNHGHVVCISSMSGVLGWPDGAAYASTKFAVAGLMMSLSHEMRMLKKDVKMTTVFPYFIQTRPEIKERIETRIPMLSLKEASETIFLGIRQELITFTVPRYMTYTSNIIRMFPEAIVDKWHGRFFVKTSEDSEEYQTEKPNLPSS